MRNRLLFFARALPFLAALAFFFQSVPSALAGPDFFGVKMKSEDFARNIALQDNIKIPDFTNDRPGTDKSIYAYAYTSSFLGRGRGLSIQVFNHSDRSMSVARLFRECVVVTRDGRRFDRSEPEMEWHRDELKAGEDAVFNVTFPGVDLKKEDIHLIIFSFELGETNIYLFPLGPRQPLGTKVTPLPSQKKSILAKLTDKIDKLLPDKQSPAPKKAAPMKESKQSVPPRATKSETKKPAEVKKTSEVKNDGMSHPLIAKCITPVKLVQSLFRGLSNGFKKDDCVGCGDSAPAQEAASTEIVESAKEDTSKAEVVKKDVVKEERPPAQEVPRVADKEVPPAYPLVKEEQVLNGTNYNFGPDYRERIQQAETETHETLYRERPWSLDNPDTEWVRREAYQMQKNVVPRHEAEVLIVNAQYGFIVFDAGLRDGVAADRIVSVYRQGRRIAKVMVNKVRDKISAGMLLPEWATRETVQVGDIVGLE